MGKYTELIQQLRRMDLVGYLSALGIEPQKISGANYWYKSPFRQEKTPSFKVNTTLNLWYDFAEGKGGNLIDFGVRYQQCSVSDFLSSFASRRLPAAALRPPSAAETAAEAQQSPLKIIHAGPIEKPGLLAYLAQRQVAIQIANTYCEQVHYKLADKVFYAVGFKNDSGGYELRNAYSKISSSPKDITLIGSGAERVAVFEGFFDFLSYRTMRAQAGMNENYLVLNSVAFFQRALDVLGGYKQVDLYLDHDQTGRKLTSRALQEHPNFSDQSGFYSNHKDLNQYLVESKSPLVKGLHNRPGLDLSL